jgi:ABC-2 type transport system permease protein
MYIVQGHGEAEVGDTLSTTLDKANITTENLSTLSADSIPKDCSILFINAPQSDFSDAETTMIKNYLTSGGKAIITLNYAANDLKNFKSIIDYYGIEIVKGRVIELDSNMHMSQYVNCLLPNIESHAITTTAKDKQVPVVMVDASGLKISDTKRSTLKVEPLLTTSDSAFSKADINSSSVEKEDGDITGPFDLGICSADTYNNVTSDLVVFSSASTFSNDTATYSNGDVLAGAVGFLSGNENTLTIPTKSVLPTQLTLSAKQVYMLTAIAVIIIPIIILIFGGIICYKRRKK